MFFLRQLRFASCYTLFCLMLLSACSSDKDTQEILNDEYVGVPVEKLYSDAQNDLEAKRYKKAVERFESVEQQYPYSEWAVRAQVMAAYSNYQHQEYEEAIAMLERFVRQHPGNDNVDYAYYLLALCYYEQITDVGRDQGVTEKALDALTEVTRRFPDTEYARSAKLKLDLVRDHLAGKEMEVGRYYLRRGDILAAINRFKYVIEVYQTTTHTAEALHRLTEAYLSLGVVDEARKYAAVLGNNYPESPWYKDSYRLLAPLDPQQKT